MDAKLFILLCLLPFVYSRVNPSKRKIIVDKEHLKHDFLNIFGSWVDIFSDAEMDFRYFAAHDYDSNKKLDGLELFAALGHDSKHENETHSETHHTPSEDIEKQVDDIFQDHDGNNDGFLDYKEFLTVQRTYPDLAGERKSKDRKQETKEL
ncbi:Multiple coagulation factor deficiency protein 2-like protein, partial [Stegodyphus mimosarum]